MRDITNIGDHTIGGGGADKSRHKNQEGRKEDDRDISRGCDVQCVGALYRVVVHKGGGIS